MKRYRRAVFAVIVAILIMEPPVAPAQPAELLLRCDDIGMCHTVNMALQRVLDRKLPVSVSVMFVCPWYQEAVEMLREHPEVTVGVHLTLNAEWKGYRWGPIAGRTAVPTLVDSVGYFFPSRDLFFAHKPDVREVEIELRAQIDRAVGSGLRIDYLDYHMGTAVDTPELRALVERLAKECHLGISRYFGEMDISGFYSVDPAKKPDTLLALVRAIEPGSLRLLVFHIGLETPEMSALVDLNTFGLKEMSKYREGELRALTSEALLSVLKEKGVRLLTYRDLLMRVGIDGMRRPATQE
jgi:predicted glycoside hydrolase/deacetylase ChbG (UPF0249 family)